MANLKIKLKKRDGSAFLDMYPEVSADNLLNASFGSLGTFSQEILTTAADSEVTYISADTDGGLNLRNAEEVKSTFGMEDSIYDVNGVETTDHNETFSDVFGCYIVVDNIYTYRENRWNGDTNFAPGDLTKCETAACSISQYNNENDCVLNSGTWWAGGDWQNLTTVLGNKADLDGSNKIEKAQLPTGIDINATKFVGVTGELGTSGTPKTLHTLFTQLNNKTTEQLEEVLGDYYIVSAATNFHLSQSDSPLGDSYDFLLQSADGIDDAEPGAPTTVTPENGDRIVFSTYSGTTPGSYTFFFTIINTNHGSASTSYRGVVGFSAETALNAFSSTNTTRHQKIIDESILRSAMRDQRRVIEFTGNTGTSKGISQYATSAGNLGLPAPGRPRALVGTSTTTKNIYEYIGGNWTDTLAVATFATGTAVFDHTNLEIPVYYDAGQDEYIYVSGSGGLAVAGTTIMPVDGDLVYWISP
jgi:hypothetical protein